MTKESKDKAHTVSEEVIQDIVDQIIKGGPVRHPLPFAGRLYIDRQVPFLCLYRNPVDIQDQGTKKLVTGLASYLIGSMEKSLRKSQAALVIRIVEILQEKFGAFLLIEIWSDTRIDSADGPKARVFSYESEQSDPFADVLVSALVKTKKLKGQWQVETVSHPAEYPDRMTPVISTNRALSLNCIRLGLSVPTLYRDVNSGVLYPVILRNMWRAVDVAIRKTVFEFAKRRTNRKLKDYRSLGKNAISKEVRQVDERLAVLAKSFDLLLGLTPVNLDQAWRAFSRAKFEKIPEFRYRPRTIEVSAAKRQLFSIPVESIEDPTMADLFREKQFELDRQLSILDEIGSQRVIFDSLQLHGYVSLSLVKEAEKIIEMIPPGAKESSTAKSVSAREFADRAVVEIHSYRKFVPAEDVTVEIRRDVAAGLMVSKGCLLVNAASTFPFSRLEALVQHEVGTHLLTYLNGRAQTFQQLSVGLPDYESTQEGLAVLAEYLVGGMSKPRLRLLAGRVIAARSLIDTATFIDTFRLLLRYGYAQRIAFAITARTYRGGGLTKDAAYLRGLLSILEYLRNGKELEPLYVGKIAIKHVGIIKELRSRGILKENPLVPTYLQQPMAEARLERLRRGIRPHELADPE